MKIKIITLLTVLFMAGCLDTGKELTFADTLSIPLNVFPSGWNQVSAQHEPEWRSKNAFLTQYSSNQPYYLNLIYWFVYYDNIESSLEFSNKYDDGIVSSSNNQNNQLNHLIDTFALTTQNYDEYDLGCIDILKNGISLQQCSAYLRYSHCNIVLSSNVDDVDMTLPDFVNILNYVDSKMPEVDICKS